MPKFKVIAVVHYPCVFEASTIEEAIEIAENSDWEMWPDDDSEISEYYAEELEDNIVPIKFTVIKGKD